MAGFGNEFKKKKQNTIKRTNKTLEKIINQAFLFHSQGNIENASKY